MFKNRTPFRKVAQLPVAMGVVLALWAGLAALTYAAPAPPIERTTGAAESPPPAIPPRRPLLQPSPALTITKTAAPNPVQAGGVLTYTLVISNGGTADATNTTISDTLPAHTTLVPRSVVITPASAGGITGTSPLLASGFTVTAKSLVTVTFRVTVTTPLTNGIAITNVAAVTSTQIATPALATVTTAVNSAPVLSIRKTAADANGGALEPGDRITYTITVSNTGNAVAHTVSLSDTLPAHTVYVPGSIAGGDARGISGAVLTWTTAALPPGAANTLTHTFAVTASTPLTAGITITNTAAVTAAEAPIPVTATVSGAVSNVAPVAVAATFAISEDAVLTATLSATDRNGDPLTYTLAVTPASGVAVITNTVTGAFTYTPAAHFNGGDAFTFTVTDTGGLTATARVTVTVNPVNDSPALTAPLSASVNEDAGLVFAAGTAREVSLFDLDVNETPGGAVRVALSALSGTLTLSQTTGLGFESGGDGTAAMVFTGTLTDANAALAGLTYLGNQDYNGSDTLSIGVNDRGNTGSGGVLTATGSVAITVNPVNDPPVLAPIGPQTISESVTLVFTATATDVDSTPLFYSIQNAPNGTSFNGGTGRFSWKPTELQGPGTYTVTITVGDGEAPELTDSELVTITVNEVNRVPALAAVGDRSVAELTLLSFSVAVSATDPDLPANTLSYSLVNTPSGATIGSSSGLFQWTPAEADGPGTYTTTIVVSDGGSPVLTASDTITITVTEVNTAPVLAPVGDKSVDETQLLSFTLSATDTDLPANGLGYSITGAPSGATLNPASGLFQWTPTAAQGPGTYPVTFTVADTGTPVLSDSETITITVVEIADLSVIATDSPDPVVAGSASPLIYTIIVNNAGPSRAKSVVMTDILPSGVSLISAMPSQGSGCSGTTTVTCNLGNVTKATPATIVIQVTVGSAVTGTLVNTASLAGSTTDRDPINNFTTITTAVSAEANLTLAKVDSADPVLLLDPLTYTLTLRNLGPSDATGVVLTDTLPLSVTFVSASTGCGHAGGTVTCTPGTLVAGALQTLTVTVTPTGVGTLINSAVVTTVVTDPTPGNTALENTTVNPKADLSITKTGTPDPVAALDLLTYTLTVANAGPSPAVTAVVTDTLPGSVKVVSVTPATTTQSGPQLGWNLGTLAPAATRLLTVVVRPQVTGTITNTAAVTSATADHVPGNNTVTQTTFVTTKADLTVAHTAAPDPVVAGTVLTYTLTITNNGPSNASGVTLTDTLPSGVTFGGTNPAQGNCAHAGGSVTCTLGALPVGQATSVLLTVTVNSAATGTLTNRAGIFSNEIDPVSTGNTAAAVVAVTTQAALSVGKTAAPNPATAGATLTYTLAVTNAGPSDARTVMLTDTLPAGVTLLSTVPGQGSCGSSTPVTCTLGTLPAGQTALVTLTVTVNPAATGTLTNTAAVTTATFNPAPANNTVTRTIPITTQADLSVGKTAAPSPATAGATLTYTLAVTNAGPSDARSVSLTDALPATVSLLSAVPGQGNCSGATTVACSLGTLPAGQTAFVTLTVTVDPAATGTLTNTAAVSAATPDPAPANHTVTRTTSIAAQADLSVAKSDSPDPVTAGTGLTYILTIANAGPSDAAGVVLTDTLPPGVSLISAVPGQGSCSGATTITCTLGTIAASGSAFVTLSAMVDSAATGTLVNTATVAAAAAIDPDPADNTATAATAVTATADLSLSKTAAPDPAIAGSVLTYTLTVTNFGPSDAAGTTLTDTLPPGVSLISAVPGQGSCSGATTITCSLGSIAAGEQAVVQLAATVAPTAGGTLLNSAGVAATTVDPVPGNNSAAALTGVIAWADLTVVKTGAPNPVLLNTPLTYTLTVTNFGPSEATGALVTDRLPAGVSFSPTPPPQGSINLSGIITYSLGSLLPGDSQTITLVVTPTLPGVLTNTAVVTAATPDPDSGNNTATHLTTATGEADLAIAKRAAPNPVMAGRRLTYTLSITNFGPSAATAVTVTDRLPPEVALVSAPGCSEAGGTVTCALGAVPSGGAEVVTITVAVSGTVTGLVTNTAVVSGAQLDSNAANNTAAAAVTVSALADLRLSKQAAPNPATAGTNLSYTLVVTNDGPSDAAGATLTDNLPPGTSLVSATPTQGSCSGTTTITCNLGTVSSGFDPFSGTFNNSNSASVVIVVAVNPALTGLLNNNAAVTAATPDPDSGNNTAAVSTPINTLADLLVTMADSADPVLAGNSLSYNLTVANQGPSFATNLVLTNTFAAGVSLDRVTLDQGTCSGAGTLVCNLGNLSPGSNVLIQFDVTVGSKVAGTLTNTARLSGGQTDPNQTNNIATEATTVTNPSPGTYYTFLPVVMDIEPKPVLTDLSVFNDNTGGDATFTVLGTGVSCTIPNNTTRFCGSFTPGTYTVQAVTVCGTGSKDITYQNGPVTTRLFCN